MTSSDYLYHLDLWHIYDPVIYGDTQLFQIGRLFCGPTSLIDTHAHLNWLELTIVTGGKGTVVTNGVPTPVEKGAIYLSFPGDFHQIRTSKEAPLQFDFFSFNSTDPLIHQDFEKLMQDFAQPTKRVFHDERIPRLVSEAVSELINKKPDEYTSRLLQAIFHEIFLYLIRSFINKPLKENFGTTTEKEELAYQIMHYIDSHIFALRQLGELSKIFGYNYAYLSNAFRKTSGDTISHYFEARRNTTAKSLLLEKKLKIKEIASLLNYSSLYSFSKAFKKETGCSPRAFQRGDKPTPPTNV
jgi:AraC-like DNA-binding protein